MSAMIKRETVEKVLVAPFRSRNTGFNVSSPPPPPPPSLLPSSWDRSDSDSDSKKVRGAGEHSRTNPQFRGFDDLRRRWPSRGFQRKARGYPRGGEGKGGAGFQKRDEMSISNRDRDNALSTSLSNPRMSLRRGEDET